MSCVITTHGFGPVVDSLEAKYDFPDPGKPTKIRISSVGIQAGYFTKAVSGEGLARERGTYFKALMSVGCIAGLSVGKSLRNVDGVENCEFN